MVNQFILSQMYLVYIVSVEDPRHSQYRMQLEE
jgi:hypothetical protein